MADDPELDRLIASLEASFDASVARHEDEAASDLALSMLQGRSFRDALRSEGLVLRLGGGRRAAVTTVGRDYLAAEGLVVPLGRAVLALHAQGPPPRARQDSLLEVLRRWCRAGEEVEVSTPSGLCRGRLACAAPDHLELRSEIARWLVALGAVEWVRAARGGSVDAI